MIPNNVLVLGPPHSGKIRLAQYITNDNDTSTIPEDSHSGLIYAYDLKTKYFSTKVNLLIEEFPESRKEEKPVLLPSLREWARSFVSEEFEELREAIDGVVFTMNSEDMAPAALAELIQEYAKVKESIGEDCFSAVFVAKSENAGQAVLEEIEDECIQHGIEYVYGGTDGTNEYKEKLGKDRIVEIFETHEWSQISPSEPDEFVKHKEEKMGSMTQKLLDPEEGDIPLDALVDRLRLEKTKVGAMAPEEKDAYVKSVVEDLMNYI